MAQQKREPPPKPRYEKGVLILPLFKYRFLFANGDVLDVIGTNDNSCVREALLAERGIDGDAIVGTATPEFVGYINIERKPDGG